MCMRCLDPESQKKVARLTQENKHEEAWCEYRLAPLLLTNFG